MTKDTPHTATQGASESSEYRWYPKECPCKSVQSDECRESGCKWERDPSLVPMRLRQYPADANRVIGERQSAPADPQAPSQEALDARRPMRWPKERDLFRADDMGEGQLRVLFDSDNDVIVALWPDGKPSVSVEFCCPGSGGGKSPRTREALIALMVAMEEDGATNRPHDAAIAKGPSHE